MITYLTFPQGTGRVTVMWTNSTVSYSTFKISNVEEFKKNYVSVLMRCIDDDDWVLLGTTILAKLCSCSWNGYQTINGIIKITR